MKTNINLHVHTDASLNDGAMTVSECISKAKELKMPAIAITDHGGCWNWLDFYNAAKENDIKPILGVEAYINTEIPVTETFIIKKRAHLVLLAKDYEGIQAISRFVSETNRNFISGRPVGELKDLKKFFGKGSLGYGHVVATSACVGGVLATPLSYNLFIDKEIRKIQNRIESSKSNLSDGLQQALESNAVAEKQILAINEKIAELTPIASKKFGATQNAIKKIKDSE